MNISEELLSGRSGAKTVSPVFTDPRELSDQRKTKEDSLVDLNQQRVQKKATPLVCIGLFTVRRQTAIIFTMPFVWP